MGLQINGKKAAPPNEFDELLSGEPLQSVAPKKLAAAQATAHVTVTHEAKIKGNVVQGIKAKKIETTIKDEQFAVGDPEFIPDYKLEKMTISAGFTKGLPNYSSAKIGISLTVPCTADTREDKYKMGFDWVNQKMEEAMADQE